MENFKLLAITPHPDDETFFFGGTLAHYSEAGIETHLLVATDGEAGKVAITRPEGGVIGYRNVEGYEKRRYAETRLQECYQAANILGIRSVSFLHCPDKGLDLSLVNALLQAVTLINPHVIITFSEAGSTYHPDHSVTGAASYLAIKQLIEKGNCHKEPLNFRRLFHYNARCSTFGFQRWAEIESDTNPTSLIDVTSVQNKKNYAAEQYKTQAHIYDFFFKQNFLQTPVEEFLLRINVGNLPSAQSDLFADMEQDSYLLIDPSITFFPLPFQEEYYHASDHNFYRFLLGLLQNPNQRL